MQGDIDSVSQLIQVLENSQASDFVKISKRLKLKAFDFKEYASWGEDSYTRNCIGRNEHYELLLLCWDAQQDTPIHCHNGEECWVYNLQGNFEEIRFDFKDNTEEELVETSRETMGPDEISYMHDNMGFHSLHNRSNQRGMTLHLYMNPIDSCRIYDEEKGAFVRKEMSYDTVAETVESD
jgi:cysteine dioxygenase